MDTVSIYPLDFGNFDDEYYQLQTSIDNGYPNNSSSRIGFDTTDQPNERVFEEAYTSNSYPYEHTPYPAYSAHSSLEGFPSTTESLVEDFQYIDFDQQSHMTEPQASPNVSYSPEASIEGGRHQSDLYYQPLPQNSSAAPCSPNPKKKKSTKNNKPIKSPHSRHVSYRVPSSSHNFSHRETSNAVESSSNVNSRPAKMSKGPPKSFVTVFDISNDSHARRKSRKPFTEEGKKKVEAVRKVGACVECRFRKRTVS